MSASHKAERLGHEAASVTLDNLLACHTQAEASPVISSLLVAFGSAPRKHHAALAGGISVALVDVLMTGLRNLPKGEAE